MQKLQVNFIPTAVFTADTSQRKTNRGLDSRCLYGSVLIPPQL